MLTKEVEETLSDAVDQAVKYKHEYVTLEHLLYALVLNTSPADVLTHCGADLQTLRDSLLDYFRDVLEKMPEGTKQLPELTSTFQSTIQYAVLQAEGSGQSAVDGGNILAAFYQAEQSLEEIGRVLNIEPNTAKLRLHRARGRLKEKIQLHFNQELRDAISN